MMDRRRTVVVVDDDRSIVRLLESLLEVALADRATVLATCDPAEARRWLGERRCDVLISDIQMPGVSGLDLLRAAKANSAWTRVIFLTGVSTWNRIGDAIENGAADYLLKPLDHGLFKAVIRQECDRLDRWQGAVRESLPIN